ncbi:hypothetical protein BKA65DRAFT_500736 [Rhexocercosporidium sp. MPI-PUGE-AT-0058]|nr:hypothetical protein BKA65DRAFT_500736 [Rhexocercosporidium sp. MPI-PUGE-AT-0058]
MFAKSVILASFVVMALADPIPAPVPQATTDLGSFATDDLNSLLAAASSLAGTDYSSILGDATAALGALSDLPTLPASVQSVLATAVPESELTRTDIQCIATSTPAWYKNLPQDAKSALSSYETALASWYSVHSSDLGVSTDLPAPCQAAVTGGASPTTTASRKGGSTSTSSGAGAASSTPAGTAAGAGTSTAAAPRATAMAAGIAGLAGMLGVMVAL